MKKFYRLSLFAVAAMSTLTASAQGVRKFPSSYAAFEGAARANAFKADKVGAINDKEKGIHFYAASFDDPSKKRGWYSLYSANPYNNYEKLATWFPEDETNFRGIQCGTWAGDAYYGYVARVYTYVTQPQNWVKLDPSVGELDSLASFKEGDPLFDQWYQDDGQMGNKGCELYCMTWNPVNGDIYAFGKTTLEGGNGATSLWLVDKETGNITHMYDLSFMSFAMAVDMDGKLWVEKSDWEKDKGRTATYLVCLDPEDGTEIKQIKLEDEWGQVYEGYDFYGTMSFDYTTGDLYWIAYPYDTYRQNLYKVDTETGVMKSNGLPMTYVGMYIPYQTADSRTAPAQVTELTATPDATGALKATLEWTNPTLQWNKETLTKLDEVLVYKKENGEEKLVETISASADKIGQKMTWTDENATDGINTYYVVACSEKNVKGVKDSVRVYCGEDVPGAVGNITLTKSGSGVKVSWEAPTEGLNNGYVDAAKIKYDVKRIPDEVVVAKDITATEFLDENLGDMQMYYYEVMAKNAVGEGKYTRSSDGVFAGRPYEPPFALDFSSYDVAQAWTSIPAYNVYWTTDPYGKGYMSFPYYSADNWLISPAIHLEGGKRYKITQLIQTNSDMWPSQAVHDFTITLGKEATAEGQTIEVYKEEGYKVKKYEDSQIPIEIECYVDVPETGTYYYGFHETSTTDKMQYDNLRFYGMSMEEVHDTDLAATSMGQLEEATYNTDNVCNVTVENKGKNDMSNYTVTVARVAEDGKTVVLGESSEGNELIKAGKSKVVKVTFRPDLEEDMNVVAYVKAEGDANAKNDTTEIHTITVLPEGTLPFNVHVEGNYPGQSTRIPMSFQANQSTSQSIYLAEELGNAEDSKITRLSYEYEGNGITETLGPVSVMVYMSNTDKVDYTSADELVSTDAQTLVYDGEVYIKPGKDQKMVMNFSTPFEYKKGSSLCVTIVKSGLVGNDYPALFKMFNNSWDLLNGSKRTILLDTRSGTTWTDMPVTNFALKDITTGLKEITATSAMWYDASSNTINFNGNQVKSAQLYDVSGKMVSSYSVSGLASYRLNVKPGLYIVRAVTVDGNNVSVKLNIAK